MRYAVIAALGAVAAACSGPSPAAEPAPEPRAPVAFDVSRCVNLANALNAPNEGEWGYVIEEAHLSLIAERGFDAVRVLINWAAHAEADAPYALDPAIFARVDEVIAQARAAGLAVIIDLHDYHDLYERPYLHTRRAADMWRQIAAHYADAPADLYYEIVNEPQGDLKGRTWDRAAAEIVAAVREHDPTRPIILGGDEWNAFDTLETFDLPDDPYLIATFHYYTPYDFTHQGADWFDNPPPLGATWGGPEALEQLHADFDAVAAWSARTGVHVFLGEFGVFKAADEAERARWTEAVREAADARGFSWCYFDFTAGFNAYDRETARWRTPIVEALGLD